VPRSRKSYLRQRILVSVIAVVVLGILFYLPLTLLAPVPPTHAVRAIYSAPTTATQPLSLPTYGDSAIAAVGYPGLLASGGGSAPLPIASITKIITALVVLQKAPLGVADEGPNILFTAADAALLKSYAARDGDVYPIQVGGTMTERQVLTIALVPSANNYARALADWAYGSEANFLPVARAWLTSHGLTSTTLTDCTGLNPQNTSTPTDLIALGKLALASPVIAELIGTTQATLPVVGTIKNTNQLLGTVGIDGIKTGTLNSAGASLLFSSRLALGGHVVTLIGVVLDGPNHPTIDAAITALVAAARSGFHLVTLATRGQVFARYTTLWGTKTRAIAARSVSVVVWGGTAITSRISVRSITTARSGTTVGQAKFTAGIQKLAVPLQLATKLVGPDPWWRLEHPGQLP
jgi:serine-type D-Ala-D-Ala carboxypeptidase (penicillin-binding protein 5/6)